MSTPARASARRSVVATWRRAAALARNRALETGWKQRISKMRGGCYRIAPTDRPYVPKDDRAVPVLTVCLGCWNSNCVACTARVGAPCDCAAVGHFKPTASDTQHLLRWGDTTPIRETEERTMTRYAPAADVLPAFTTAHLRGDTNLSRDVADLLLSVPAEYRHAVEIEVVRRTTEVRLIPGEQEAYRIPTGNPLEVRRTVVAEVLRQLRREAAR